MGRLSNRTLFAGTAWHYARYRPGYPSVFFTDLVARFQLDGTGRLLDLGCGTGQLTLRLAEHVAASIGVDPEPEMLNEAARRAQAAGVGNVSWAQGSSADLPGELGRFDLVTMGRSFHWMDREQFLTALDGMVNDNGGLVIANDSCLIRSATGPGSTPSKTSSCGSCRRTGRLASRPPPTATSLTRKYWRALLSGTCSSGPTNSRGPGRSSGRSVMSTRPRRPFVDYSVAGGQHSNKKSPTHCSRSTARDDLLNPSP